MKLKKGLFITLVIAILAGLPAAAHAAIIPPCALGTGVPQLSCFLELGVSVSKWILGITGSLALLFFVYGGFLFLTSRGASDQITKGKTVLTQATIGIIIIFGAYIAINFLVANVLKAKFTTEIPKEATPAAQTQSPTQSLPPAPAGPTGPKTCICAMSTTYDFPGFAEQVEILRDNYLSAACQSAQGVYDNGANTCKPGAGTPLANGCITFSITKDGEDVTFSCSMK